MNETVTFHVLPETGDTTTHTVPKDELLESLQQAVGDGLIEVVYNDHGQILLVNEEGRYRPEFRANRLATQKAQHVRGFYEPLVGPAVIISSEDFD